MCVFPRLIKNKKYEKTKKNGGVIPAILDKRTAFVPVGCGDCIECRQKKAREWQVRIQEEIREGKKAEFITLTFSNEAYAELNREIDDKITGYERDNEIATKAVRRFAERWRKRTKKSIRHWLVTELGGEGTENIHLHGIVWTDERKEIEKTWGYGYVYIGEWVNNQTVNYIVKYIMKQDNKHKHYKPKILTSPGIGEGYMNRNDAKSNKYIPGKTREYYTTREGIRLNIPIYLRNKIYTEEEREKLWIEKLDTNERWILGSKVQIIGNEEDYLKTLKQAQSKSNRLGYGNGKTIWIDKEHEEERRIMMQEIRIRLEEE